MNNIYQDDESNGDLCSEYKLKTTMDGAVMDCSYWCIEGRNEYSVDLLDRTFCAGSDTDRGLCMEGSCDMSQPLNMALMHRYRETKPGERARGSTTPKISTKLGVSVGNNASTVQFIEPNIRSSEIGYPAYSGRFTPQQGNIATNTGVLSTLATESAMTVEHSHSALALTMTPAVSKPTTYKNIAAERTFYVEHYMPTQSEYAVPATTLDTTSVVGREASYRGKEERTESTTRVVGIEEVNIPDPPEVEMTFISNQSGFATTVATNARAIDTSQYQNSLTRVVETDHVSSSGPKIKNEFHLETTIRSPSQPVTNTYSHETASKNPSSSEITTLTTSDFLSNEMEELHKLPEYRYETTPSTPWSKVPLIKQGTEPRGHSTATLEKTTHKTTANPHSVTIERSAFTHVRNPLISQNAESQPEGPGSDEIDHSRRYPYVIFTDFFYKFATTVRMSDVASDGHGEAPDAGT
ncbi:uncharacterized protein LOC142576363 isoform X2 [Dermacentor variabilis]|uniref:uncharacterized protein LOC142576363 isoform X2 n=1 Tax=Dermacentor variabilis TaxID=34621 RepID=UPI003F5AEC74